MSEEELTQAIRELAGVSHLPAAPDSLALAGFEPMPVISIPNEGPEREAFDRLAAEHPLLRDFYENEVGKFISANVGIGWRIQSRLLADGIVGSAVRRVLTTGADPEDVELLGREAAAELRSFLALLRGDLAAGVTFHAFSGVTVPQGIRITLPWGTVRAASEYESRINLLGAASPSLLMEGTVALQYHVGEPSGDRPLNADPTVLAQLTRGAALLPLAALLSGDRESYLVCQPLWNTTLLPGSLARAYSGSTPRQSPWVDQAEVLTDEEQQKLVSWGAVLHANDHPSLDVAIRRTLSAVRERSGAEDTLIDAVIAMESVFGHGAPTEVGFRVTSAIAVLLEPDAARRAEFRSRLNKLYNTRSEVVHGGMPDPATVHEHKEEAVRVAVDCLKVLFRDYPQLISDRERGIRIILRNDT